MKVTLKIEINDEKGNQCLRLSHCINQDYVYVEWQHDNDKAGIRYDDLELAIRKLVAK